MGFAKKKREEWREKSKAFFTSLKKKKTLIEISLTLVLLLLGFVAYLSLTNRQRTDFSQRIASSGRYFQSGVNHYRLENYERAEMNLTKVMETSKSRATRSLAALYLGNIFFKRENYSAALDSYRNSISNEKNNVFALYNSALAYLKLGESLQAMRTALRAFELRKDFNPNLLLLGNIYYATGKYKKALSMYIEADSGDALFQYNRARTYLKLNRFEDALESFERIVENEEGNRTVQGISFFELGYLTHSSEKSRSIEAFRRALSIFPSSSGLRYNLALSLLETERYGEAVSLLESIESGERYEGFDRIFGRALFKSGSYNSALTLYEALYKKTEDPGIAYIIGDTYVKLGDATKAKTYYRKALIDPVNEGVIANLSRIYQEEGLYEQAEKLGMEYLEKRRNTPMPYRSLADLYFAMGRVEDAKRQLELATQRSGDDVSELIKIAHTFQKHGHHNNALQIYYRILSLNPEYHLAGVKISEIFLETGHNDKAKRILTKMRDKIVDIDLFYTASLLHAQVEKESSAKPIYQELIEDFPYRYEAYLNLSLLYLKEHEYDNVIDTIRQCLKNSKGFDDTVLSDLHTVLGATYYYRGDYGLASKEFKTAMKLDATNDIPALNLSLLR